MNCVNLLLHHHLETPCSRCEISECMISSSCCEISDDVMVLIWSFYLGYVWAGTYKQFDSNAINNKFKNKLMTNTSCKINLQSKQDVICHVAKVNPATSAHYVADAIPLLSEALEPRLAHSCRSLSQFS